MTVLSELSVGQRARLVKKAGEIHKATPHSRVSHG
jgi:hypothetical protein